MYYGASFPYFSKFGVWGRAEDQQKVVEVSPTIHPLYPAKTFSMTLLTRISTATGDGVTCRRGAPPQLVEEVQQERHVVRRLAELGKRFHSGCSSRLLRLGR